MNPQNPLELETPEHATEPAKPDRRPPMPEPLPVRLVAIEDVHLPAPAGAEVELDAFYVGLLQFQRADGDRLIYHAENFDLYFDIAEGPIAHDTLRPLGVEVLSLAELEQRLIDLEREYTRLRGTTPGRETLLIRDPAGNWVEIGEVRLIA